MSRGEHRVVRGPRGRLWVNGPQGYGQRFTPDAGRRFARQHGISDEEIEGAPSARSILQDLLVDRSAFAADTGVMVEEAPTCDRLSLLVTAWLARELLTDPDNARFADLVLKHGPDIYVEQRAPWSVWDVRYSGIVDSPGVDDVSRSMRLLSSGATLAVARAGAPSRRFVALDLERTWDIADQYARLYPDLIEEWQRYRHR
jgi:hypothetical protein